MRLNLAADVTRILSNLLAGRGNWTRYHSRNTLTTTFTNHLEEEEDSQETVTRFGLLHDSTDRRKLGSSSIDYDDPHTTSTWTVIQLLSLRLMGLVGYFRCPTG
jgi:hypothetical protein